MFKFSAFAENYNLTNMLNEKNCVNSTRNCVHWMYRLSGFAENYNSADIYIYIYNFFERKVEIYILHE